MTHPKCAFDALTRDERMEIYKLAGEGFSFREIANIFNEEKKKSNRPGKKQLRTTGVESVLAMPEAFKFVTKYRMEFLKQVKEIPIADKKIRLDDLDKVRTRLMYLISNVKIGHGDKVAAKFLQYSRTLLLVTEAARNEMENRPGTVIGIGINNNGELSELSDEQIKSRRDEILRKARIIIQQRSSGADDVAEGIEGADKEGSAPVLLATPEELQRGSVQGSELNVPDLRQPKNDDSGLPAV